MDLCCGTLAFSRRRRWWPGWKGGTDHFACARSTIAARRPLDLEGRFMEARLIEHNEPIFVSGLGEAPFYKFFEQYRGLSIASTMVVGTPYGDNGSSGSLVYLDGMTKATASVRIAHESILAATFQVAREKMKGVQTKPPAFPKPNYQEDLT